MAILSRLFGKRPAEAPPAARNVSPAAQLKEAVGQLEEDGDVQGLVEILKKSGDANVRRAAAQALSTVGDESAVDPLITSLKDTEYTVAIWAAAALAEIGDRRALGPLNTTLKEGHPGDQFGRVKAKAKEAINKIEAAQAASGPLDRLLTRKWSCPLSGDTAALARVVIANCERVSGDKPSKCERAVNELAMRPEAAVHEVLCYAGLVASESRVREAAAEALRRKADPKITQILCAALHYDRKVNPLVGSPWTLPCFALEMLRIIGDKSSKGAVAEFLDNFRGAWRWGDSMLVGDAGAMMALGAQLANEISICIAACRALAALAGADAFPVIEAVRTDPYWGNFDEIRNELSKLAGQAGAEPSSVAHRED